MVVFFEEVGLIVTAKQPYKSLVFLKLYGREFQKITDMSAKKWHLLAVFWFSLGGEEPPFLWLVDTKRNLSNGG